jgi:hypothetical protein
MDKTTALIIALVAALLILPFMLSSCSENDDDNDSDISFDYHGGKKTKSARSVGGSHSFSGGK